MGGFYDPYIKREHTKLVGRVACATCLAIFVSFNLIRKYASPFSCLVGEVTLDGR